MRLENSSAASPHALALIRISLGNALATLGVQVAACIGVVFAAPASEKPVYLPWLVVSLAVAGARLSNDLTLSRVLRDRQDSATGPMPWQARLHLAGLVTSGSLWAALAWWRLPLEGLEQRYVLTIVLSALAGGATGVLAPLRWTGRLYVTLILTPACIRLIEMGGVDRTLGVLGLVFWVVMIVGHRNNHALIVNSLELASDNRKLVEELQDQKSSVEAVNQSLTRRVAERTRELKQRAIEAQAANRAKSDFLATMSHEIRTPLNGVIGMAQIMSRDELPDAQRDRLNVVQSSANALLRILNDVIDIAKIENGDVSAINEAFDFDDTFESIVTLYRPIADENGLNFRVTTPADGVGYRMGDPVKLRQILGNLIANAVKFTQDGGVTVDCTSAPGRVTITIADTGPGIPAEKQTMVFDRFTQLDSSSTRVVGGAGLGLAICRELAQVMGGELTLKSEDGEGATFTLTLPLAEVARADLATAPRPHEVDDLEGDQLNILVVDDNANNRLIISTILEQCGVRCSAVANGAEAVAAWERDGWSAILMDVHMPVMDGVEATRVIRERELAQQKPKTPIVAITASVMPSELETYRRAGVDDVLSKPIMVDALLSTLARNTVKHAIC